ncbi:hypothetical protein K461DRAFT_11839 [Myriangium duriaei CBS 260.36]|uniref:Uncharacterized protein n=1 Tax=Myriangium duriaei CBS 260.36 TaxID=1168546 RepID=A0A9P4JE43_9PEZI|nr:hypothetical protein K461DRAFT_11839 [Myriangium duriaei CBS 260.36]
MRREIRACRYRVSRSSTDVVFGGWPGYGLAAAIALRCGEVEPDVIARWRMDIFFHELVVQTQRKRVGVNPAPAECRGASPGLFPVRCLNGGDAQRNAQQSSRYGHRPRVHDPYDPINRFFGMVHLPNWRMSWRPRTPYIHSPGHALCCDLSESAVDLVAGKGQ